MIFLMMTDIDTPENKRKFVILYEKYKYLMQKVAMDVLHGSYFTIIPWVLPVSVLDDDGKAVDPLAYVYGKVRLIQ